MFGRLFCLVSIPVLAAALPALGAESVAYSTREVDGVTAQVVTVNMNDPRVKVSVTLCKGFPNKDEPFTSLVKRSNAVAAVDGTYFDESTRIPIGDIVVDGRVRHEGRMATAMAITPENKVSFGRVVYGHPADWTGYETVLEAGPTLVKGGKIDLRPRDEHFRDPDVLGVGLRTAVGLTGGNKLLLVTIQRGITLQKLAEVMKALGCVDAMNLDGGSSQALSFGGKVLAEPGRRLTNLLVVQERATHIANLPAPLCPPEGNGSRPVRVASRTQPQAPEYPGARAETHPRWVEGPALHSTPDDLDQVVQFYRGKLGSQAQVKVTKTRQGRVALLCLPRREPGAGAGELHTAVQVVDRGEGRTLIVRHPKGFPVPRHYFDR